MPCLDHIHLAVDKNTYQHICDSQFLREVFGTLTTHTVQAGPSASWTGTYLFGTNTYFEFLPQENGDFGFALTSEELMSGPKILDSLREVNSDSIEVLARDLSINGTVVPWFSYTRSPKVVENPNLSVWFLAYRREFLDAYGIALELGHFKRKWIRDRRNRVSSSPQEPLMGDICEIELYASPSERSRIADELLKFGFREGPVKFLVDEFGVSLASRDPIDGLKRLKSVRISLTRPIQQDQVYDFGPGSQLRLFKSGHAIWEFY